MEIVRMSELPILYRTLYDVDTLPKKVLEELTEMSGQKKGICQGKVCLTQFVTSQNCTSFNQSLVNIIDWICLIMNAVNDHVILRSDFESHIL